MSLKDLKDQLHTDEEIINSGKPLAKYVTFSNPLAVRALAQCSRLELTFSAFVRMAVVRLVEEEERGQTNSSGENV